MVFLAEDNFKPKFWDYVRNGAFIVRLWFDTKVLSFHNHVKRMKIKGIEIQDKGRKMLEEQKKSGKL